ncbi:MAG: GDSL-type esterase/lipase family protein, partial [Planctomycetota bacterium]
PNQLAARLHEEGTPFDQTQIVAKTGWTTGELLQAIESAQPAGPFDLVSLLIGVNNQYRGLPISEFADELNALLSLAIRFADGDANRVLVLSIPDWSVTPFAADRDRATVANEIDRFNECKRQRARASNCHFIDVTPISRLAANDRSLLASDELHPSASMYSSWCTIVLPFARIALTSA